jgi:hypothetical protein
MVFGFLATCMSISNPSSLTVFDNISTVPSSNYSIEEQSQMVNILEGNRGDIKIQLNHGQTLT